MGERQQSHIGGSGVQSRLRAGAYSSARIVQVSEIDIQRGYGTFASHQARMAPVSCGQIEQHSGATAQRVQSEFGFFAGTVGG